MGRVYSLCVPELRPGPDSGLYLFPRIEGLASVKGGDPLLRLSTLVGRSPP